jgi:hypothetical protein
LQQPWAVAAALDLQQAMALLEDLAAVDLQQVRAVQEQQAKVMPVVMVLQTHRVVAVVVVLWVQMPCLILAVRVAQA